MKNKIQTLHEKAIALAQTHRRIESDLIDVLMQMDGLKGFLEFGVTTLHDYAERVLGLSADVSSTLIRLARKSRDVPALQEKIKNQEIKISQARLLVSILTPENQGEWLKKAAELPKRALEKEIFAQFPREEIKERIKPVNAERLELRVEISEELESKLRRLQDLLSQKQKKPVSLEETIEALTNEYLERHDPVQKAERAQQKKPSTSPGATTKIPAPEKKIDVPGRRVSIPAALKHQVNLRDRNQCTERDPQGARCQHRRWLDIHHIMPVARGGKNELENLTTLCSAHHKMWHKH